jgi:hypothetical protein
MNEKSATEHSHHEGNDRGHRRGMNAMGLLMAGGTAILVAVLLVPSLGWPLGIVVAVLAGAAMLAMHGGAMGGHDGTTGRHKGGC